MQQCFGLRCRSGAQGMKRVFLERKHSAGCASPCAALQPRAEGADRDNRCGRVAGRRGGGCAPPTGREGGGGGETPFGHRETERVASHVFIP